MCILFCGPLLFSPFRDFSAILPWSDSPRCWLRKAIVCPLLVLYMGQFSSGLWGSAQVLGEHLTGEKVDRLVHWPPRSFRDRGLTLPFQAPVPWPGVWSTIPDAAREPQETWFLSLLLPPKSCQDATKFSSDSALSWRLPSSLLALPVTLWSHQPISTSSKDLSYLNIRFHTL